MINLGPSQFYLFSRKSSRSLRCLKWRITQTALIFLTIESRISAKDIPPLQLCWESEITYAMPLRGRRLHLCQPISLRHWTPSTLARPSRSFISLASQNPFSSNSWVTNLVNHSLYRSMIRGLHASHPSLTFHKGPSWGRWYSTYMFQIYKKGYGHERDFRGYHKLVPGLQLGIEPYKYKVHAVPNPLDVVLPFHRWISYKSVYRR